MGWIHGNGGETPKDIPKNVDQDTNAERISEQYQVLSCSDILVTILEK